MRAESSPPWLLAIMRWGYDKPIGAELDPDRYPDAVRAIAPLNVLSLRGGLQMLTSMDLPAVLEFESRPGERRYVALLGLFLFAFIFLVCWRLDAAGVFAAGLPRF